MFAYQAFDLKISSNLEFPELLPLTQGQEDLVFDVSIKYGKVAEKGLENPTDDHLYFQTSPSQFWMNVPDIGRYLVLNGKEIIIDPVAGIDEASIRVFLLGSCMGALLFQRNFIQLHGNAIKIDDHCISFVGHSGAGKSTLSGAFFKRGYSILADDVCSINEHGEVVPSFPQIKLWQDAADQLKIDTKNLRRIRPDMEKFAIPLGAKFQPQALPLKTIYILNPHNQPEFVFEQLTGMEKFSPLKPHTYRQEYLKGLGQEKHHFAQCIKLSKTVRIVSINRPMDGYKLDELVEQVLADIQKNQKNG